MPRNHDTVKAADLRRAKSKAKVIEWETRAHSRGIRDVPVQVRATASQPRPRKKASRGERAQKNDTLQGGTAPQPMDVDETFWVEEPAMPTSEKRVRSPHALPSELNLTCPPPSPSELILKNFSPRSALTYAASSILRAFPRRPHARVASLLRLSGGALTAFLHLYSARSAAKNHISDFLFTEFKNGSEDTSCHRGCARLGCVCN